MPANRNQVDEPVSIHAVERHLGSWLLKWMAAAPRSATTGKRSGGWGAALRAFPSLASQRMGREVEIRDVGLMSGGTMHFGIPAYRLPRVVLLNRIQRIVDYGVTSRLTTGGDVRMKRPRVDSDVGFMAIGAHIGKRADTLGPGLRENS